MTSPRSNTPPSSEAADNTQERSSLESEILELREVVAELTGQNERLERISTKLDREGRARKPRTTGFVPPRQRPSRSGRP